MLRLYPRAFATVEVDSTFYAIPAEPVVRSWSEQVPEGFVFALKVPQEVTHERRLLGVERVLERFLSRVRLLEGKLGPLLLQLSPAFDASAAHRQRLRDVIEVLPEGFRWAVEFRHAGWLDRETLELLTRGGVALVLADSRWIKPGRMQELAIEPTARFGYVRWLGRERRVREFSRVQVDREAELSRWAEVLRALAARVETIYGYVNNHYEGHSPHSVRTLQRLLGQPVVEPQALQLQRELF